MILDIKKIVTELKQKLKDEVSDMHITPKLTVLLVGENPASISYVRAKEKACQEIWMLTETIYLPENIQEAELISLIKEKNIDTTIHGILVQFPLPAHINKEKIIQTIASKKDVDGFGAESIEKMFIGNYSQKTPGFLSCTPKGIVKIIESTGRKIAGSEITLIGNGNLTGKPLSLILGNLGATTTICNKNTKNLSIHTKNADIVVVAAGVPGLIKADMIQPWALVIDVGINRRTDGKLCGDCLTEEISQIADITPVPGGVGIMTVAMLLENTLEAART